MRQDQESRPYPASLTWTGEGEEAFVHLAPAETVPDYIQPFHLYVLNRHHYATAMYTQISGEGGRKHLVAH